MRLFREGSAGRDLRALLDARQTWSRSRPSGSTCWRRSRRSTRRRSTIPTTPSAATRGCWGSTRPTCAPTARWNATTPRASAGAISRSCWARASASRRPPRSPDITFRRAELRATRLDDVDGALDLLESIVRTAPQHEGARRLLEKLLAVPDQRQRVARILEPLYEASGAWARLVAVLEVQREALEGRRGGGDAGAHRRSAGEQAAGAHGGAGDLAAGAGGRSRATPTR